MLAYVTERSMSTAWRMHGLVPLLVAISLLGVALYLNHRATTYQEEARALEWERIDTVEREFCLKEGLTAGLCKRHAVAQ